MTYGITSGFEFGEAGRNRRWKHMSPKRAHQHSFGLSLSLAWRGTWEYSSDWAKSVNVAMAAGATGSNRAADVFLDHNQHDRKFHRGPFPSDAGFVMDGDVKTRIRRP
eukprot:183097-Amphidinium_carterae.1